MKNYTKNTEKDIEYRGHRKIDQGGHGHLTHRRRRAPASYPTRQLTDNRTTRKSIRDYINIAL